MDFIGKYLAKDAISKIVSVAWQSGQLQICSIDDKNNTSKYAKTTLCDHQQKIETK